jgi:hypothetical protein
MGLILPLTWNNNTQNPPIGRIEIFDDTFFEKIATAWQEGSEFCLGGWAAKSKDGQLQWKMLSLFPKPAAPAVQGSPVQLVITHETSFGGG